MVKTARSESLALVARSQQARMLRSQMERTIGTVTDARTRIDANLIARGVTGQSKVNLLVVLSNHLVRAKPILIGSSINPWQVHPHSPDELLPEFRERGTLN
jgi:hypothetical protein